MLDGRGVLRRAIVAAAESFVGRASVLKVGFAGIVER